MALKSWISRLTPLDRGVVILLLSFNLAAFRLFAGTGPGERVIVERSGEVLYSAPLATDGRFAFRGPLGETRLEVRNGTVRIVDSPCPHKDCMAMGPVSRRGELLACVPNRLLVRIDGEKGAGDDYDLLSR